MQPARVPRRALPGDAYGTVGSAPIGPVRSARTDEGATGAPLRRSGMGDYLNRVYYYGLIGMILGGVNLAILLTVLSRIAELRRALVPPTWAPTPWQPAQPPAAGQQQPPATW